MERCASPSWRNPQRPVQKMGLCLLVGREPFFKNRSPRSFELGADRPARQDECPWPVLREAPARINIEACNAEAN